MIVTNATDASKKTVTHPKIEDHTPTQKEMERAILLAAHDLIEHLHKGKVPNPPYAKSYFGGKLDAHIRTATVPRPELKEYREVMKMNWNEFTSYVVCAARYVCYHSGGDSGDVSTIARKMYDAGIAGVEKCTGQWHGRKPAFKYFNDTYLHEIYTGAVNTAVRSMVQECESRLTITQNKTALQVSKAAQAADEKNSPVPGKMSAKPKVKQPIKTGPNVPAVPSPAPIGTVIQSKAPMVSAPAK